MSPKILRFTGKIGSLIFLSASLMAVYLSVDSAKGATLGRAAKYGTINGSVRDSKGNPLAGAVISLVREGAKEVAKEIRSSADGNFVAKMAPGRYSMNAQAAGYDQVAFNGVEVRRAEQLYYRFNLTPLGMGRTLPERRSDRDSAKWRLRSSQARRSILQVDEDPNQTIAIAGNLDPDAVDPDSSSDPAADDTQAETRKRARTQGVVETYFSASENPRFANYSGVNFAVLQPVNENFELVFSGQMTSTRDASRRFDASARYRVNSRHTANVSFGAIELGRQLLADPSAGTLGQYSIRAVDEWIVRDGIVLVVGLDYSRFTGLGSDASITPRFGVQMDANANTRLKLSFAPGGNEGETEIVPGFEGNPVAFRSAEGRPVAMVDGQAVMERSHRLEFGVERILDNRSSVEATAFFDTTSGRGLGLLAGPISMLNGSEPGSLERVARQDGNARGFAVVYSRRMNHIISASAGYSFGRGQKLSPEGITDPADLFENGYFQTAAAQISADLRPGTRIQTVFRFSPGATVFAIDPFAGRLAVYDPSLSILITQDLPTFGLPVRAEAVVNAGNILDTQVETTDGATRLSVNGNRRLLRGGILVRF
jgi:hypothetical protein